MLALCVAGIFIAVRGEDEAERVVLEGRTERGQRVELVLYDGQLESVRTRAPVHCPEQRVWRSIRWSPVRDRFGRFGHAGSRFSVYQRADARRTGAKTPDTTVVIMRGVYGEGRESARGTIEARWHWDRFICRARVRFRAD